MYKTIKVASNKRGRKLREINIIIKFVNKGFKNVKFTVKNIKLAVCSIEKTFLNKS